MCTYVKQVGSIPEPRTSEGDDEGEEGGIDSDDDAVLKRMIEDLKREHEEKKRKKTAVHGMDAEGFNTVTGFNAEGYHKDGWHCSEGPPKIGE